MSEHEHDYDNDPKHQEALERVTMRLLNDRVARRLSAAHASNTRTRVGHAPEDSVARTLADALADSYLRTEALARAFTENTTPSAESEEPKSEEPAAFHGDLKDAALKLHAQGLTYAEIARRVRVNPSNVRNWCLAQGAQGQTHTPRHGNARHSAEARALALKLRLQGLSLSHISREVGAPTGTVHWWLKLAGLTGYIPPAEPTPVEHAPVEHALMEHAPPPVWTCPLHPLVESLEPTPTEPPHATLARLKQITARIKELEDKHARLLKLAPPQD